MSRRGEEEKLSQMREELQTHTQMPKYRHAHTHTHTRNESFDLLYQDPASNIDCTQCMTHSKVSCLYIYLVSQL